MLLDDFEAWVQRRRQQLAEREYSVESRRCGEQFDNQLHALTWTRTPKKVARITIWVTGECDLEVLDVESERTEFWQHRVIGDTQDLDHFQDFLQALGIRETWKPRHAIHRRELEDGFGSED